MEFNNRLDSFTQYIQRNVLVGRMDGVGLQTESHQYGFDAQYLLECGDNGNTATADAHDTAALTFGFDEAAAAIKAAGFTALTVLTVNGFEQQEL